MRSGSSAWVMATRESIVGVSDVTDSVAWTSGGLDVSSVAGVGGFGGGIFGGGVGGGVNCKLERAAKGGLLVLGGN